MEHHRRLLQHKNLLHRHHQSLPHLMNLPQSKLIMFHILCLFLYWIWQLFPSLWNYCSDEFVDADDGGIAAAEAAAAQAQAEQQRLVQEAEQQRLVQEAEQQRLAQEAEQQRLKQEAEQEEKRLAEEEAARIAAEEEAAAKAAEASKEEDMDDFGDDW